ncbi:hypothetical protein R2Q81_12860 [Microbacterium aquimaris]|uniref:hypothetical protein n=1 Tax=Microbacterium aquimaris TaxID=459816 RepID=UPI002AD33AC1|nr:hypothetical protein [Microbacterium aquimaris]MDZ8276832.1 hypothetical protein [Microbacterium aquimaris]
MQSDLQLFGNALSFRKDDPRRKKLIAEVYAVPRWEGPFWDAEQLERALSEGAWERIYDAADGRLFNRWALGSAVARNAEHPDTFEIPSREDIATLEPGDEVKLMFDAKGWSHGLHGCSGERMSATITKVKGERFEGKLDNSPAVWNHLHAGAKIKFSGSHIIDCQYAHEMNAPAQNEDRNLRVARTRRGDTLR